ncbi:response regulator transcription factor [Iodobacter fluviatilis]|uniref:LuxR family two component transcriptional regulator n=1 Tax=Iodobacter fluviatilis TaxID=537 RepID=A0A377Q7I2_9NEIS|nr:response regulator transcription factor [Iodobacter fluviatilis]TCU89308.1 LuxR family two component transcriptional regulator [Iodobacter fluviatilis]STQ90678.1 Nitrogen regulation protein C [Iodobacter fluviatilis]
MNKKVNLMILDDHDVVRAGLETSVLHNDELHLLGSFRLSEQLLVALKNKEPDIILLDFSLGSDEMDGFNLIQYIHSHHPKCKILVVSAIELSGTISLILRAGAKGFFSKTQPLDQLNQAIRTVYLGRTYLSTKIKNETGIRFDPKKKEQDIEVVNPYKNLSIREAEVIRCCLSGMTMTDIAGKFSKSIKTVSAQKLSAFKKIGVNSDRELFILNANFIKSE